MKRSIVKPFSVSTSGAGVVLFDRLRLKSKRILDLGCGGRKFPNVDNNVTTVDIRPECKPDIVCNFLECVPLPNNSFDLIHCSHVLEHIREDESNRYPGWDDMDKCLSEVYRLLKKDGDFVAVVPSPHSGMAVAPDHKTLYSPIMWKNVLSRKFKSVEVFGVGTWVEIPELMDTLNKLSLRYPFLGREYLMWFRK
jgi:SAM-dependent methyltransferase